MNNLIEKGFIETNSLTDKQGFDNEIKSLLETNGSLPDSGQLSKLALVYYHYEKYDMAVSAYEKALQLDPSNIYFKEMLQLAKANQIAEVHIPVPDVYYFNREKLLSKPLISPGALPKDHTPAAPLSLSRKLRLAF